MSDEDAFIRALREPPDDETTRLVYTDWLDDRSDPRAEYLRAEAAWVALQPSDEQYRPLYRRVSQLAARLEPKWFATVSRMGHLVRQMWERVGLYWLPHERDRITEPRFEWANAYLQLSAAFGELLPAVVVQQRFCIPADYFAFMTVFGGSWRRDGNSNILFSAPLMAQLTATNVRNFVHAAVAACYHVGQREMWVRVATLADAVDFVLCCDLDSSRFGEVAECGDYRPWMSSDSEQLRPCGETFLRFFANFSADE